jgi:hypothetical protein
MDTRDDPNSENAVAERLLDGGRRFAARGDLAGAETRFARAVLTCPTLVALNKLALLHLEHRHGPEEALGIVAPNLGDSPPQSNAHALAARCHARLSNVASPRQPFECSPAWITAGTAARPPIKRRVGRVRDGHAPVRPRRRRPLLLDRETASQPAGAPARSLPGLFRTSDYGTRTAFACGRGPRRAPNGADGAARWHVTQLRRSCDHRHARACAEAAPVHPELSARPWPYLGLLVSDRR